MQSSTASFFCYQIPEAAYFTKKKGLFTHNSGDSRAWHLDLLGSREGLIVDGMTMVSEHEEERLKGNA
jgi:hypothetical protein